MSAELVRWLLIHDIQLATDGTALHYDAPPQAPDGFAERLRDHKPELIAWLSTPDSDGVCSRHPLSYGQYRLWQRHTSHPDPSVYNVRWELDLDGPVRPQALGHALTAVVARHEALRTRFVVRGGQPVAEVMAPPPVPLSMSLTAAEPDAAFDLGTAPLLRARLTRRGPDAWTLLLVLHHLACDHITLGIVLAELSALYRGEPLDPPVAYASYARWEARVLGDPVERTRLLGYWRAALAGAELRPPLPTDRPRPAVRSGRGAEHRFEVAAAVVRGLDAVARRCGSTRYVVLCTAFALLLRQLTGQPDVVVITSSTTRTRPEDERVVGVLADALALRVRLDQAATLAELVTQVGTTLFAALDHRPMPLGVLVEDLCPAADPPVPTVLFTVLGGDPPLPRLPGVRATVVTGAAASTARMELYLTVLAADDELTGFVEYATDLFDPATIDGWCVRFADLLAGLSLSALSHPPPGRPAPEISWRRDG